MITSRIYAVHVNLVERDVAADTASRNFLPVTVGTACIAAEYEKAEARWKKERENEIASEINLLMHSQRPLSCTGGNISALVIHRREGGILLSAV